MRCLLTADLHASRPHWDCLLGMAPQYDLVAIAGDVLDLSLAQGPQLHHLREYLQQWPVPLALCCGNHDGNDMALVLPEAFQEGDKFLLKLMEYDRWMDHFRGPKVLTSGESRVFHGMVITSLPWGVDPAHVRSEQLRLLREGAQLRAHHHLPWMVLHHVPPSQSTVAGGHETECVELGRWLEHNRPDACLCGHMHPAPFTSSYHALQHDTLVFNPGHHKEVFTAIEWDTRSGEHQWIRKDLV